jgi:hypothetical protein
MSYLQVICEQHRLVEQHLDKFASQPGQQAPDQVSKKMDREVRTLHGSMTADD